MKGQGLDWDYHSCIPADTPFQNKNSISVDVYKHITLNQFDNKFYRFRVRAKNQVGTNFGPLGQPIIM